jgi:hypothetical protein
MGSLGLPSTLYITPTYTSKQHESTQAKGDGRRHAWPGVPGAPRNGDIRYSTAWVTAKFFTRPRLKAIGLGTGAFE